MGIRIDLYKREDIGREIRYIPLMDEFLNSEELADRLTWSVDLAGKGDESGVFGFVSYETLKEIANNTEVLNDMSVEDFDMFCKAVKESKEEFGCYVAVLN